MTPIHPDDLDVLHQVLKYSLIQVFFIGMMTLMFLR